MGAVVVAIAAAAVISWMAYLVLNARSMPPGPEETPKNLQPFLSDDELESTRITRVLGAAVVAAGVLAIVMPVYFWNEANRQQDAAEGFHELDVEEGERWFSFFSCIQCHGPAGVGGGAVAIEPRSGLSTSWAAPSLNDVFYRYSEEEIKFWINYGRSGTPMPSSGLVGGGAMTEQEVDQVIEYLRSVQLPQAEALAKADALIPQALSRMENADERVAELIGDQEAALATIEETPRLLATIGDVPSTMTRLLSEPGTCTDTSAELVSLGCAESGADADRDGITDAAEARINELSDLVATTLDDEALLIVLDPADAFSGEDDSGTPISDLDAVDGLRRAVDTRVLSLRVTAERQDVFRTSAQAGLDYLTASADARAWSVDFEAVADAAFDRNIADAQRAAGLFNAYCARCHTAGYSAGVAFEQGAGSGAWAPALAEGRSVVQFPSLDDQIEFIIAGSELAKEYGINGIGRGWMPGFGQVLSREDIELIVRYERSM